MSMTWKGCLALAAVGALFIGMVACGGQEPPPPPPTTTTTQAPAPAAEEGEMEAALGVPECDDFIAAYTACLEEKVPEEARTALMESLEKSKEAWKEAAATEEGKAGLAAACTEAATAAKEAVKSYECEW